MLVRFNDGYAFVHSRDKAALARIADSYASPAAKEIRIVGNDAFVGRIPGRHARNPFAANVGTDHLASMREILRYRTRHALESWALGS
jgi:hypothetical protein